MPMSTTIRRYAKRNLSPELQDSIVLNDLVLAGDVDGDTSIQLTGYRALGYEKSINEALVWMLENFSSATPPSKAIKGQLWFNDVDQVLYAYNGADYANGGDSTLLDDWIKPVDIQMSDLTSHLTDYNNPHQVTKTQVGLPDVVNGLQLLAANNLSDVPDAAIARDNLEIYSKDYIDANFVTIINGANASTVGGITANQFVRSDINDDVDGTLTYKNNTSISTLYDSGTPLTHKTTAVGDLGDVKIGFNKGKFTYAMTSGINFNELNTNTNKTDMFRLYRKTGNTGGNWRTTASIIGMVTESHDINEGGVYIGADGWSAANNDVLPFTKMLHVGVNNLSWGSDLVVTDAGFITRGNITPYDDSPVDASSGQSLGSSLNNFKSLYCRNINTSIINCYEDVINDITDASEISYRTNNTTDPHLKFTSLANLKIALGVGGSVVDGVAIGSIMYYPSMSLPTGGYLYCDGSEYLISEYPTLAALLGTTFGVAAAGKFKVPKLNGEFIRGYDATGIIDPRALGSWQEDEFKSHTHTIGHKTGITNLQFGNGIVIGGSTETSASGGGETRPRNVALVPMIKALSGSATVLNVVTQATESISGVAKVASQALVNAGTNHATFVSPLTLDTLLDSMRSTSAAVTYTGTAKYTLPHGLTSTPSRASVNIKLKVGQTDLSYPAGRSVVLANITDSTGGSFGVTVSWDATNVYVNVPVDGIRIISNDVSPVIGVISTVNKWELIATVNV